MLSGMPRITASLTSSVSESERMVSAGASLWLVHRDELVRALFVRLERVDFEDEFLFFLDELFLRFFFDFFFFDLLLLVDDWLVRAFDDDLRRAEASVAPTEQIRIRSESK